MNDLFKHIKNGELVLAVPRFQLKGQARYVFAILRIFGTTRLIEDDRDWWRVRAIVLAADRDLFLHKLSMNQRLAMRNN